MDLTRIVGAYSSSNQRWRWNAGGFSDAGTYQVFYFTKDDISGNVSMMKESIVYKAKAGNAAPNAFSPYTPLNNAETLTTLVFDWEDAVDPNGDDITYTLMISENDSNFTDPITFERLPYSTAVARTEDGLADLSAYYWKVVAVDEYGAATESAVRYFTTNNTNPVPAVFEGHIFNSYSGESIAAATVQAGVTPLVSGTGGFFQGVVIAGPNVVIVSKAGYQQVVKSAVNFPAGGTLAMDFEMVPTSMPDVEPGDIDMNNSVEMNDADLTLKINAGVSFATPITVDADVDGDGALGPVEMIYILQRRQNRP